MSGRKASEAKNDLKAITTTPSASKAGAEAFSCDADGVSLDPDLFSMGQYTETSAQWLARQVMEQRSQGWRPFHFNVCFHDTLLCRFWAKTFPPRRKTLTQSAQRPLSLAESHTQGAIGDYRHDFSQGWS